MARTCWAPGGGAEGQGPNRNNRGRGNERRQGEEFPGVDDAGLRNPPRANGPRKRTLADGQIIKWCGLCGLWTDHYRAGHPTGEEGKDAGDDDEEHVAFDEIDEVDTDAPPSDGAFARLHAAGLI